MQNNIFSQSSRCGHDNFTRKAETGEKGGSGVRYRFEIVVEARSEIRTPVGFSLVKGLSGSCKEALGKLWIILKIFAA